MASKEENANKALVLEVLTAVFIKKDISQLDRYFSNNYIQHNPSLANGLGTIKSLVPTLGPDFVYEPGMVTAEGDLVMVHGRYTGWGPKPMVAVDIFRIQDGKLTEHWDVMQEEVPSLQTVSGNSMFSRP